MKKRWLVFTIFLLSILALSGCFPKLKDEIKPPSWDVGLRVPLTKGTAKLANGLDENDQLTLLTEGEYEGMYGYSYDKALESFTIQDYSLKDSSFNIEGDTFSLGKLFEQLNFSLPTPDKTTMEVRYPTNSSDYIGVPFNVDAVTLSGASTNYLTIGFNSNDTLDRLTFELYRKENEKSVLINSLEWTNVSPGNYPDEKLMLASKAINSQMYFKVTMDSPTANSTVDFTIDSSSNIEVESITSNITDLVADPTPTSPETWDMPLDEVSSDVMELPFPESIKDSEVELYGMILQLMVENSTPFKNNLTLTIKTHETSQGTKVLKKETVDLVFDPRSTTTKGKGDLGDSIMSILNSKPKYISISLTGTITANDVITMKAEDFLNPSITPSIDFVFPIALNIPDGGVTLKDVMKQETTLEESARENVNSIKDNMKSASLNIKYNNKSHVAFGATARFIPNNPELESKEQNFEIKADQEGIAQLTVNTELLTIIGDSKGYKMAIDLTIPNNSGGMQEFSIKQTDKIDITAYLDGTVNTNVD